MTIVTGRVAGEGEEPLLYDAELRIAGGDPTRHLKRGVVTITTDDGGTVEVKTSRATVLVEPRDERGKWGDLLDDPLSRPFDGEAPGDHVQVALSGVAIKPGDLVAVLGDEDGHLTPDGYRGAKVERRALEARVVAQGDAPEDALSRWQQEEADAKQKKEEERRNARRASRKAPEDIPVRLPLAGLGAGIVVAIAGLALSFTQTGPSALRVVLPAAGILLTALSTMVVRRRRFLPSFATPAVEPRRAPARWSTPELTGIVGLAIVAFGLGFVFIGFGLGTVCRVLLALSALLSIFFAVRIAWDERRSGPLLRMLLGAPEYHPGESGMRSVVLSVDRGKLRRERTASKSLDGAMTWEFGRGDELNQAEQFELCGRTADETMVHVRPGGALFGSTKRSAELSKSDTAIEARVAEEIDVGDEVLVLGRFEKKAGELEVSATGPESLLIVGAAEEVRATVRRALRGHQASVAGLVALGLVAGYLAWLDPYSRHETIVGEVTSVFGRSDVQPGDVCAMKIAHDVSSFGSTCHVQLECGGVRLFGSPISGFVDCSMSDEEFQTPAPPGSALSFTPPNHVEARPESGSVIQIVVER